MTHTRILVVDDDTDFAESLAESLKYQGYPVDLAFSGTEALDKIASGVFDLVLMDIMMPEMNGVQCLEKIRREHPHTRIWMMTGYNVSRQTDAAMEQGASEVLSKPLNIPGLINKLTALCSTATPQ